MRVSGSSAAVVLMTILLLAPLLYVASTGPLIWFASRDYIPEGSSAENALMVIYWPLEILANNCQPVSFALDRYIELWAAREMATPAPFVMPVMATPIAAPTGGS